MKQHCREIQAYLYEQIALSKAMKVQVIEVKNDLVILTAQEWRNIQETER